MRPVNLRNVTGKQVQDALHREERRAWLRTLNQVVNGGGGRAGHANLAWPLANIGAD
jgi:hypothetical protein